MRLGDFFPQSDKDDHINRHLKPGQVVYLLSGFTNPPKEKYLVIAYYGSDPLLFVINSRINPYIAQNPDLNRCQIKILATDYGFLDHDSYINCSEVIDTFNDNEIKQQLSDDLSRIKGGLSRTTKQDIINVVKNARTISPRHKSLIIQALSQ